MKGKATILKGFALFVLLINVHLMQAQENQQLDERQQNIVSIAALTATGSLEQLKTQLIRGLEAGLTVNEIKEILVQLYAYCGFPRSLNGINTFMAVLEERKAKGIADPPGEEGIMNAGDADRYERGRKVLEELTGIPQAKPAPGFGEFAPRIDAFLKEHLFADIFDNKVLSYQQRELVTVSALAAMTGVEPQLKSHLQMAINTGITRGQLSAIASIIGNQISKEREENLTGILTGVSGGVLSEPNTFLIRIAEIEITPDYANEYYAILKEEAETSVRLEPGVLAIFPMSLKEDRSQIRILEIYADQDAYQQHLKTPHFLKYKTTTAPMVKSLKLMDMEVIDRESMPEMFRKVKD